MAKIFAKMENYYISKLIPGLTQSCLPPFPHIYWHGPCQIPENMKLKQGRSTTTETTASISLSS